MQVAEFKNALEELRGASENDAAAKRAVSTLLTRIDGHEGMSMRDFIALLLGRQRSAPRAPRSMVAAKSSDSTTDLLASLRASLMDDDAFSANVERLTADRSITKAMLVKLFADLFDATPHVRSKATRRDIVQLILDERTIQVRNKKMGALLGRRTATVE